MGKTRVAESSAATKSTIMYIAQEKGIQKLFDNFLFRTFHISAAKLNWQPNKIFKRLWHIRHFYWLVWLSIFAFLITIHKHYSQLPKPSTRCGYDDVDVQHTMLCCYWFARCVPSQLFKSAIDIILYRRENKPLGAIKFIIWMEIVKRVEITLYCGTSTRISPIQTNGIETRQSLKPKKEYTNTLFSYIYTYLSETMTMTMIKWCKIKWNKENKNQRQKYIRWKSVLRQVNGNNNNITNNNNKTTTTITEA